MRRRIHVNQHIIKANGRYERRDPPLTVKTYKSNTKASHVDIKDSEGNVVASVIYSPDKPLDCGAKVWIETEAEVEVR